MTQAPTPTIQTTETRARSLLGAAVGAGSAALAVCALSVARWAAWLLELQREGSTAAHVGIVADQLLMLSEALVVIAITVGATVLRLRPRPPGTSPRWLGAASLLGSALVVGQATHGWYLHLQHLGPLVFLLLAAAQAALLIAAGLPDEAPVQAARG